MSIYVQLQSKSASYENRWIAIGDSAVSFDPLSSQGMLTALYSAKLGAEAIFFQYFNGKKKEVTVQPLEIFQQYIEDTFRKYKSEKRFFIIRNKDGIMKFFGKDDTRITLRRE